MLGAITVHWQRVDATEVLQCFQGCVTLGMTQEAQVLGDYVAVPNKPSQRP
jgi:hypothetical protein